MSDLISRQAAIDELTKHLRMTDVPASYPGIITALTEWLNELPSVQPERKTGKWNWISFNIECSECGFMPDFDSTEPLYKFCPNCGAKMEEGD